MAEENAAVPPKIIRTYAADIAAAQSQTPPVPQEVAAPAITAAPPAPEPASAAPFIPPPPPPVSQPVFPVEVPPGAPSLVPPRVTAEPTSQPLHTYAGDFSDRAKATDATTMSILAAQQDAGPSVVAPTVLPQKSNLLYVLAGVVMLLIGIGSAGYAFVVYQSKTAPVPLVPLASAPIFVDDRQELSGTGAELQRALAQSMSRPLAAENVRLLYTPESVAGTAQIFSALTLPLPGPLARNINQETGMAGIVNVRGMQTPFFMLAVSSYGETFAGMLSWEPTMLQDFASLFPAHPQPVAPSAAATTTATSTATTTPSKTTPKTSSSIATTTVATSTSPLPVHTAGFGDEVVANHDVRVYRDAQNRAVLLYGYWNQSTLLIARDGAAFAELIRRLSTSRAQ